MAMGMAIETHDLTRAFPSGKAVDHLTFDVRPGEVLALLGPNGAGKTTTIRMLNGVLRPDGGTARVLGIDPAADGDAVRRRTGVLTENAGLDERLTARENLAFAARIRGLPTAAAAERAGVLLERFGMSDDADRQIAGFSTGQRKRVALARALLHDPEVLFLDEPTTGLDPRARAELWTVLDHLVDRGTTLVLTTQYLDEAERLADDIIVIDHGRIIARGDARKLKREVGGDHLQVVVVDVGRLDDAAGIVATITGLDPRVDRGARSVHAPISQGVDALVDTAKALAAADIAVDDLSLRQPTLDEVFLDLTGSAPDDTDDEERS